MSAETTEARTSSDSTAPRAGIRSIGWWVPPGRQSAAEIAAAFGLPEGSLGRLGFVSKAVPGPEDHPTVMGARATRAALDAAGLGVDDLDLLIYGGNTRDWPSPWVAAFGVLSELGARRATGFDFTLRCSSSIDALWIARTLVEAGTFRTVAVCCAERYDSQYDPSIPLEVPIYNAMHAAGAATAIVALGGGAEIRAFSTVGFPDLSMHRVKAADAGGTRQPLSPAAVEGGEHLWRQRLSVRQAAELARLSADADRHNYAHLRAQAGFEHVDFVATSPMIPEAQLEDLEKLGIPRDRTLFTVPLLGHIGSADLYLILGIGTAIGKAAGDWMTLSNRTSTSGSAIALSNPGGVARIATAGEGVDVELWRSYEWKGGE